MSVWGALRGIAVRGLLPAVLAAAVTGLPVPGALASPSNGAMTWGGNEFGQLGNGTLIGDYAPVAVSGLSGVVAVSAGGNHTLALLSDGTVVAWGRNSYGELGDGTTTNSDVPVAVPGLSNVVAVSAGGASSLALMSDGTVKAWGINQFGQLGIGSTAGPQTCENSQPCSLSPVTVSGLAGATAISAGGQHCLALRADGVAMAWGDNEWGQLGDATTEQRDAPVVAAAGAGRVIAVSAGGRHSLALLANGEVIAWGEGNYGQLGNNTFIEKSSVSRSVDGLTHPVVAIAAGFTHSLALLDDGTVMSWGANDAGELGNGTTGLLTDSDHAVAVSGLSGVDAIAAGASFSVALLDDGDLSAWGNNEVGQLANGTDTSSDVPVALPWSREVLGIAAGASFGPPSPPVPAVTSITPRSGAGAGGTAVTVTGTGFTGATGVSFGTTAATSFTVLSNTELSAVAPTGVSTVSVTVATATGVSPGTTSNQYFYVPAAPAPVVKKLSTKKGTSTGGTTVTVNGANFIPGATPENGALTVMFGSVPASSFTVTSSSSVTAVTPPGAAGKVDVTIATVNGTSAVSSADRFDYQGLTVLSVAPSAGPLAGGETVTVTGTGFAPGASATSFRFGKTTSSVVNCSSTTTCTAQVPPATKAGAVDVVAVVGKSKSRKSPPADRYSYS